MPYSRREENPSILVPIFLMVFAIAIAIAVASSQVSVKRSSRNTKTMCTYLKADAKTRGKQASNSAVAIRAASQYIKETRQLERAFRASADRTNAQRAFFALLQNYLHSGEEYFIISREQSEKNAVLSSQLAARATALTTTLKC